MRYVTTVTIQRGLTVEIGPFVMKMMTTVKTVSASFINLHGKGQMAIYFLPL